LCTCSLRTLSCWLSFLRTKDRLLRSHYSPCGFLYSINTSSRELYDDLVSCSQGLSSFSLDIFHELKLLHSNLNGRQKSSKHFANYETKRSQMKRSFSDERPKKKKSAMTKSKTQILQKEGEQKNENKFKKLQLQWEMMSVVGQENKKSPTTCTASKIPRPISSAKINK